MPAGTGAHVQFNDNSLKWQYPFEVEWYKSPCTLLIKLLTSPAAAIKITEGSFYLSAMERPYIRTDRRSHREVSKRRPTRLSFSLLKKIPGLPFPSAILSSRPLGSDVLPIPHFERATTRTLSVIRAGLIGIRIFVTVLVPLLLF